MKPSAKSMKNLQSWQPGQTGNPLGRPKGHKTLRARLKELMDVQVKYMDLDGVERDMKVEDALGIVVVAKALTTGDMKAVEMIKNELAGESKEASLKEWEEEVVRRAFARFKDVTPVEVIA